MLYGYSARVAGAVLGAVGAAQLGRWTASSTKAILHHQRRAYGGVHERDQAGYMG